MLDTRILLSGAWMTTMLLYLMGDVLRIYSGDWARMEAAAPSFGWKWLLAALIMVVPIVMVFGSLILPQNINRVANLIVGGGFFLFVLLDMGSYPGAYDKFLFVVSLCFKAAILWLAWHWAQG